VLPKGWMDVNFYPPFGALNYAKYDYFMISFGLVVVVVVVVWWLVKCI